MFDGLHNFIILYMTGYYLNLQLRYEDMFSNYDEVRDVLNTFMDKILSPDDRLKADLPLDLYDKVECEFGSPMAKRSRMLRVRVSTEWSDSKPHLYVRPFKAFSGDPAVKPGTIVDTILFLSLHHHRKRTSILIEISSAASSYTEKTTQTSQRI
ncbi:hypothetical protein OROGR_031202 [Orobanche gracilis]